MNKRFTWTCERIHPLLLDDEGRRQMSFQPDTPLDPPVQACDFAKVAEDEWNALLVVRFWRWVSTLLPDALVRVHDEGDYILAGYVVFTAGQVKLDAPRIESWRAYMTENGFHWRIKQLDIAMELAERHGLYFAELPGSLVWRHNEIAPLGLSLCDLQRRSLNEVADLIRFPWQKKVAS